MRSKLRTAPTNVGVTVNSTRLRTGTLSKEIAEAVTRRYRLDRVSRWEVRFVFLHRHRTFRLTTNRFETFHLHEVAPAASVAIQVAQRNQTIVIRPTLILRIASRMGRQVLPIENKSVGVLARYSSTRSREVARVDMPV